MIFKNIILKEIIFPFADILMHTSISKSLNQINYLSKLNKDKILLWQNKKLKELINHAYVNTEYYKDLFDSLNIKPSDIQSINDLNKLPILTKDLIRKNYIKLIPKNIKSISFKENATGGSSGDPLVYLLDNRSWSFTTANNIYNWEKTGYSLGDKYVALGSTSLYISDKPSIKHYIYYKIKNKVGLNGINMSDEVCEKYVTIIKNKKILYLYGYASSIYMLAKYVNKNSIRLNINACMPTSEILTDEFRGAINRAFNCTILNCYGVNDGGVTGFEHDEGFFEVGYNVVISQKNINKNSIGEILSTDLLNYSMPFINYLIGDEIQVLNDKNEAFNYNGQVINQVLGRSSDVIEFDNGTVITGPGFTILFKDLPIEYYQIEKSSGLSIICKIKKLPGYNKSHEKIITSTLDKQLGKEVSFELVYTDKFETSDNGKIKYFKS